MIRKGMLALACGLFVTQGALAGTAMLPQPVQVGDETGRYNHGIPVSSLEMKNGAVVVTPLPLDHGSVAFDVAVYNDGEAPANFDVSDVSAKVGTETVSAFTVDELEKAAKTRAMWRQVAVAVLAGAAAAAVANAHTTETSYGHLRTRYNTYSWVNTYRDNSLGVLAAGASVAAGAAGIATIGKRLDETLDMLNGQVVQRTTVDPQASYGGRIVLRKIKDKAQRDIRLAIHWNGETYPFAYRLPKKGEAPPPALKAAAVPSRVARGYDPAVIQDGAERTTGPIIVNTPVAPPSPQAPLKPVVTPAVATIS